MGKESGYKKQQKLSFAQFLAELPNFVAITVSADVSGSLIVWVDFMDSLGNVLRTGMVSLLTGKLSKDLRYEYNYGVGKVEAMAALFCDGIVFFGLLLMSGLCIYELLDPGRPSDVLVLVVGLKVINVTVDAVFFRTQWKIKNESGSAIMQSSYAAALGALLFDSVTLFSLLLIWLLRNNPLSWYICPVISIFIAAYLIWACIKRIKSALVELTDKTLPEEIQIEILKVMTRFHDRYSLFHFVKSHRDGNRVQIDIVLSFEPDTSYLEIIELKKQLRNELSKVIDNCNVNIIVE